MSDRQILSNAIKREVLGINTREKRILDRYGELLTAADLAEIFRYSSAAAVRQAHTAGRLPVALRRFPKRRGWFATAEAVMAALDQLDKNEEAAT